MRNAFDLFVKSRVLLKRCARSGAQLAGGWHSDRQSVCLRSVMRSSIAGATIESERMKILFGLGALMLVFAQASWANAPHKHHHHHHHHRHHHHAAPH
jgi:hypothetical protein